MDRFGGRALERQFGSDSAMRGWYPPDRITALGLVKREISLSLRECTEERPREHTERRRSPASQKEAFIRTEPWGILISNF